MVRFLVLFLFPINAFAKLSLGLTTTYVNINDPIFNYVDKPSINLDVGSTVSYSNYLFNISTNRFLNQEQKFTVKSNGIRYRNESKVTTDTLLIGFKEKLTPTIFLSNVDIRKKLYYNDTIIDSKKNNSWVYGFGIMYFANKNTNLAFNVIAPNVELDLEGGISLAISYLL